MKQSLYIIFLFLFSITISGQETTTTSPEDANAKYFEVPRETLYFHLNKSTYLLGEEIWFKGYAYDRKNQLPSEVTTNFNVELFDHKGNEVFSGLYLGYQGSTQGNIKIDSTWASGDYYVRTSTNWMNNFIEDDSYTQKIRIVNQSIQKSKTEEKVQYDFQLLPEGGHIVYDTDNTVGFKLINNRGYGVPFDKGTVIDDQGQAITTFKSNQFGIGKFSFAPQQGKQYTATLQLSNQQEIIASFPKIQNKGIAISINNLFEDKVIVELNTNAITLNEHKDAIYYLLVHQNDASKKIAINLSADQTKKIVPIKREELFDGMNTITLFQENTPVLERLLFNPYDKTNTDVRITHLNSINDSLILNVAVPKKEKVQYDISVSVLPEETKSYEHQDNIHSGMLLNPYVQGFIENPKYYFTNTNRRKAYDLDLLLITQGWSRYKWNTIFNQQPKVLYDFNNGLTIKGKLQNTRDKDITQVYLYPTNKNTSRFIDLDDTNAFTIKNYYVEKNEPIRVSAIKSNGKLIKTGLYLQTQEDRFKKSFTASNQLPDYVNTGITTEIKVPEYFYDDAELLDEVVITGKVKKEKNEKITNFLPGKSKTVTERDALLSTNIADFIARQGGFRVNINTLAQTVTIISNARTSISASQSPAVFLDNTPILDFSILLSIRTADIENVYIDNSGFGGGIRGGSGIIRMYSRKTPFKNDELSSVNAKFSEYNAKNGFQSIKEFYNPAYTSFATPFFRDYGTIHWQPYVNLNESGTGTFKIPDTETKNIKLFIEGMGSDGSLISKVQVLELN
ncbi:hypothetical protein [Aquimarina sp. 2201CG14-23]|uniref:hypothetical protein n=1 Tax=Aquimarina mycalae TaxID=3040073 RepID=UPI002477F22F|nr:hypothetical protein [Aquimarina sp. 2201CG14-23]MDH7446350.1 hypothetical protein [Aquimarina sp. 2201CG14-23]